MDDVANGLSDFLITIEMFFAAVAHVKYVVHPNDVIDPSIYSGISATKIINRSKSAGARSR